MAPWGGRHYWWLITGDPPGNNGDYISFIEMHDIPILYSMSTLLWIVPCTMTWFVRHNGEQLLARVILLLPAVVAGKLCNNVKMKITITRITGYRPVTCWWQLSPDFCLKEMECGLSQPAVSRAVAPQGAAVSAATMLRAKLPVRGQGAPGRWGAATHHNVSHWLPAGGGGEGEISNEQFQKLSD